MPRIISTTTRTEKGIDRFVVYDHRSQAALAFDELRDPDGGVGDKTQLTMFDPVTAAVYGRPEAGAFKGTVVLDADMMKAIAIHATGGFCAYTPLENLRRIALATLHTIQKLDAWNDRAREDEEHPPYGEIVAELRLSLHNLLDLGKGLLDHGNSMDAELFAALESAARSHL